MLERYAFSLMPRHKGTQRKYISTIRMIKCSLDLHVHKIKFAQNPKFAKAIFYST